MANWRKLKNDFSKRRAVLARLWMPVGLPLSLLLFAGWAYEFVSSEGALSLPAAGFLFLTLVVLLASPVHAIRIAVLRMLAFVTDLLLLAATTFSLLWVLRTSGAKIGGWELMVVVWSWFLYFLVWDYWFGGTAGKRFFGLRLNRISFLRCVIRTSFILLLPLFLASFLSDILQPNASPFRFVVALAVRQAILALIPISILVLGGNQGIVDCFLSTEVVSHRASARTRGPLQGRKTWAVLLLASAGWGVLFGWLGYVAYGRSAFGESLQPSPSKHMTQYWIMDSPEATATLWQHLPKGVTDPSAALSSIRTRVAYPNPFRGDTLSSQPSPSWVKEFLGLEQIQIITLSFQPGASLLTKLIVIGNLGDLAASQSHQSKPQFVVVEVGSEGDFGVFFTEFYEIFILRAAGPETTYSSASRVSVGGNGSLDRVRWLLLGDWHSLPP